MAEAVDLPPAVRGEPAGAAAADPCTARHATTSGCATSTPTCRRGTPSGSRQLLPGPDLAARAARRSPGRTSCSPSWPGADSRRPRPSVGRPPSTCRRCASSSTSRLSFSSCSWSTTIGRRKAQTTKKAANSSSPMPTHRLALTPETLARSCVRGRERHDHQHHAVDAEQRADDVADVEEAGLELRRAVLAHVTRLLAEDDVEDDDHDQRDAGELGGRAATSGRRARRAGPPWASASRPGPAAPTPAAAGS